MMSKKAKKIISLSIASIICMAGLKVFADNREDRVIEDSNYIISKVSNPQTTEGEADGLIPETDRANGYVWGMAETGQHIYMGTNRNFLFNVVRQVFGDGELSKLATEIIFKGDIATDTTDFSGKIIRYNKDTDTFETAYSSPISPDGKSYENAYRSGLTFKTIDEEEPSVYIGGYGSSYTRVLKFKADFNPETDTPEVVFSVNSGNTSIRAMAEHNNKMYLGSMIVDEDLRILESADPAEDNWQVIANLADFDNLPSVGADSTGTAGVFDLISYNGYLYAIVGAGSDTSEEHSGFMVFKGQEVGIGAEGANEAGWKWDVVVGEGGKYEKGMGVYLYNTATAYKYTDKTGKEYVYVGSFPNAVKSIMNAVGFDFELMYESFLKPTQLYRFDENDNWELVMGTPTDGEPFTNKIGNYNAGFVEEGSEQNYSSNQYVWRMSEYNDKLFAGTFDASTLYDPFVPDKIVDAKDEEDEMIKTLLAYADIINQKEVGNNEELAENLRLENTVSSCSTDEIMAEIAADNNETEDKDLAEKIDSMVDEVEGKISDEMITDLTPIIPEELTSELESVKEDTELAALKEQLPQEELEEVEKVIAEIDVNDYDSFDEYLEAVLAELEEIIGKEDVDKIRDFINEVVSKNEEIENIINKIIEYIHSEEVIKQFEYIKGLQEMLAESEKGFDLFVSEDGVNFENLTTNGLEDGFNMGLRTFVSSSDGLYLGTANPFYGCQLWKINEKSTKAKTIRLNEGAISLDFHKDIYEYEVAVDNSVDEINVYAEQEDSSSEISYNEINEIAEGTNVIEVLVTNVDGESEKYSIYVTREAAENGAVDDEDQPTEDEQENPSAGNDKDKIDDNNGIDKGDGIVVDDSAINKDDKVENSLPITGGQNSVYIVLISSLLILAGSVSLLNKRKVNKNRKFIAK